MQTVYSRSLLDGGTGGTPQIRLLELLPDNKNQPIRCCIRYEDLNSASSTSAEYSALSYCWGDETNKKSIIIDHTTTLWITANLYSGLYHLRDSEKPKLLWVDAICINQEDTREKNQQVALMRQIYSTASSVLIWLGAESLDSHAAFKLMSNVLFANKMDRTLGIESRNLWQLKDDHDHWGLPLTTDPIWYDLSAILQRPWFRRAWVIQELAVSAEATLICGSDTISWEQFGEIFAYPATYRLMMTIAPVALTNFSILDHARGLAKQSSSQHTLHVLMRHRQTLTSNPRDKMFAFGGLVTRNHDGKSTVEPEYGRPIANIYRDFAIQTLKNDKSLKILSVPRVTELSSIGDLPSWVPDWSVSDQAATLQSWGNDEKIEGIVRTDFTATGSSIWKPLFNDDHTRLGLRGTTVDRILFAAPEISNHPDQDDIMQTGDLSLIIRDQNILKRWETVARCRILWEKYPTGEKIMDVYWQTLMAGTTWFSYEATKLQFDHWDCASCLFRILQFLWLDHVWFSKTAGWVLGGICTVAMYFGWTGVANSVINFWPDTVFKSMATPMLNRRLIRTEAGLVGLGPKLTREAEDFVALCEGGALPLIVRPKGDDWEIVGDCYIHGIMKGEIYDSVKHDFKTMWFV